MSRKPGVRRNSRPQVHRLLLPAVVALALAWGSPPAHVSAATQGSMARARVFQLDPTTPLLTQYCLVDGPPAQGLHLDASIRLAAHSFAGPDASPDGQGDFLFEPFGPDDDRFNQASAYCYVYQLLSRLERAGLGLADIPVTIQLTYQDQPTQVLNPFGPGPTILVASNVGNRHSAKAADVIYHEAFHAAQNQRMPSVGVYPYSAWGGPAEWGVVAEGTADYYAAVMTGDPRIGEWLFNTPAGIRSIETDPAVYYYGNNLLPAEQHARGLVVAGALWGLRAAVGEDVVDALVASATQERTAGTVQCFADGLRAADLKMYLGAHRGAIDAAFGARRIFSAPPVGGIVGPRVLQQVIGGTFTASVQCGVAPYQCHWRKLRTGGNAAPPYESVDLGTETAVWVSDDVSFTLELTVTDRDGRVLVVSEGIEVMDFPPSPAPVFAAVVEGPASFFLFDQWLTYRITSTLPLEDVYRIEWLAVDEFGRRTQGEGPEFAVQGKGDFALTMTAYDGYGRSSTKARTVSYRGPTPSATVVGPVSLAQGEQGNYSVAIQGAEAPYGYEWYWVREYGDGQLGEPVWLGNVPSVAVLGPGVPFTIQVELNDAVGRVFFGSMNIGVTGAPGSGGVADVEAADAGELRLRKSVYRSGEPLDFVGDRAPAGSVRVEVVDVSGRRVGVASGSDAGPAGRGTSVAAPEAPGVYFVRIRGGGVEKALRFVVVR